MIEGFHFINADRLILGVAVSFLFLGVFIWKEWKLNKKGFVLNVFLAIMAIASLLVLFLKPATTTEVELKGVLLTNSYDVKTLDSLRGIYPKLKEVTYGRNKQLQEKLDSVAHFFILGEGVPAYDFWLLKDKSVTYLENKIPEGILKLKYTQNLNEGEDFQVKGMYNQPKNGTVLALEGPGNEVFDSLSFDETNLQSFDFSINTKVQGKFVYNLIVKDSSGQEISKDPLPVVVKQNSNLKILIVNGFPSFETKYLKNFLADAGHSVVVRSQITKGKYKFEYLNTEKKPLYGLSKENLEGFDLVILDSSSYSRYRKTLNTIKDQVLGEGGFGIFVQPDVNLFQSSKLFENLVFKRDGKTKLTIKKFPKVKLEKYPYQFSDSMNLRGLMVQNHTFFEFQEKGKLGTTLLKDTYQLLLNGKPEVYRNLWSEIINGFSNERQLGATINSTQHFAFLDEPYPIEVKTDFDIPRVEHSKGYLLPLQQDVTNANLWKTRTYPTQKGWNAVKFQEDSTVKHNYFVMDNSYWKSLRAFNRIKENKRHFNNNQGVEKSLSSEPIPAIWFFISFLLSMGLLWVLPKIYS